MCNEPDQAVQLFTCPRQPGGLRLSPAGCAALWRRGKTAEPGDPATRCHGCEIGARHAGEPVSAHCAPVVVALVPCVRCGATGRRMIHARGLCVSCYNREREIERGRDARGKVPLARSAPPVLAIRTDIDLVARPAVGRVELALWAAKTSIDSRRISRPGRDVAWLVHDAQVSGCIGRQPPAGSPVQPGLWPGFGGRGRAPLSGGPWGAHD